MEVLCTQLWDRGLGFMIAKKIYWNTLLDVQFWQRNMSEHPQEFILEGAISFRLLNVNFTSKSCNQKQKQKKEVNQLCKNAFTVKDNAPSKNSHRLPGILNRCQCLLILDARALVVEESVVGGYSITISANRSGWAASNAACKSITASCHGSTAYSDFKKKKKKLIKKQRQKQTTKKKPRSLYSESGFTGSECVHTWVRTHK